jgi:hypothetical protein
MWLSRLARGGSLSTSGDPFVVLRFLRCFVSRSVIFIAFEGGLLLCSFGIPARRLHSERPVVVDGDLRLTYRSSGPLRPVVGVAAAGRRGRAIASPTSPPTRTRSSSRSTRCRRWCRAGALNYRLIAGDFHMSSPTAGRRSSAHADYLECLDHPVICRTSVVTSSRSRSRDGWLIRDSVSGSS